MRRQTQILAAAAGGAVLFWGLKRAFIGKRIRTLPFGRGIKLKKAVTINRPAEDLYCFWRDLRNVARLFDERLSVDVMDDTRSKWTFQLPALGLQWDAEITIDRQNEMIGWRSLDGSDVANAGYARFERATGGRGTVVRVALQYNPPAGKLGAGLSALLGQTPDAKLEGALRRLKNIMEAGEIPVGLAADRRNQSHRDEVDVASEESFPASDAPAWTGTTGPL